MFKLVVLSALVALAVAKPGHLYGGGLAYSAVAAPAYAVPSAVSHSYRTDVVSKPVVATYAAPVIQNTILAAPAVHTYAAPAVHAYAAPAVHAYAALPAAVSHQSRVDVHSGLVAAPLAYAAHVPSVHAW